MDRNRQKYVELSLAGRWLKLAREIIIDNPGITESAYMELAAPLMPTHIRRNGKKSGQVALATEAVRTLVSFYQSVELVDGKLTAKKFSKKGYVAEIVDFATRNGSVSRMDLPHIETFSTLVSQLYKRNVLKKIKPGVYAIAEVNND